LRIDRIRLLGSDAGRFTVISGALSGSLISGASRSISVRYRRDRVGLHDDAYLSIDYTYDNYSYEDFRLPLGGETAEIPEARLWLEDQLVASGDFSTTLTISVDHPYAAEDGDYSDQSDDYQVIPGGSYVIVSAFSAKEPQNYLESRQRKLDALRESDLDPLSREMLTETLLVMGQTWMEQTTLNSRLINQLGGVLRVAHHRFGVMAQESGYFIDVKTQISSSVSRTTASSSEGNVFKAMGYLMSALEHGVLEQLQVERPAASTVKLLSLANDAGTKIFFADAASWSSIEPQLTGYSADDMAELEQASEAGADLILPATGQISLRDWQGKGYISVVEQGGSIAMRMAIGGGYDGGYGAYRNAVIDGDAVRNDYRYELPPAADTVAHARSKDPVDMVTGAFVVDRVDLALGGGEPRGLSLARSYNSGNHLQKTTMGYGWRHSYDVTAVVHSAGPQGLGTRGPEDCAALAVASTILIDLMSGEPPLKHWVTASLIGGWAMDQLHHNAVSFTLGNQSLTYLKLPDGSFNPPPGITTELVEQDGAYTLVERFGTRYRFDTEGRLSSWRDVDGNELTLSYSGDNLTAVGDVYGRTLTFAYTNDLVDTVTDSTGRSVSYVYDAAGNLTEFIDPEQKTWSYGYDDEHRITTLVDALRQTTITNTYDGLGRVARQVAPRLDAPDARYELFFAGHRNVERDPEGYETIYRYDERGREIGRRNKAGHQAARRFDGRDHLVAITDPRGFTTTHAYDAADNLIRVTDPLQQITTHEYDEQHRRVATIDPLTHRVDYSYDAKHHPRTVTVYPAAGRSIVTATGYYPDGLVHTVTDGRAITTTTVYDEYGQPATITRAVQPPVTTEYSTRGTLQRYTDQGGTPTAFAYDDRGLVTGMTDAFGKQIITTYDDNGRVATVVDRLGHTAEFSHTVTGELAAIAYEDGDTISFAYDIHDNLATMTDPSGTTSYTRDPLGRPLSMTDPNGFTVGYRYDENGYTGLLTTLIYPGDKQLRYDYDELNRLSGITDWQGRTATYFYDAAGRLTGYTNFNGSSTGYAYDNADRLTGVTNYDPAGTMISAQSFVLDGNGNRVDEQYSGPYRGGAGLAGQDAVHVSNRLTEIDGQPITHDDEGRLLSRGDRAPFTFNDRGQLIGADDAVSYLYDGGGNRLQVIRDGRITYYIYDGAGTVIAEADANKTITRYYIHGATLLAMEEAGGNQYCYHSDAIGNTVAVSDPTGSLVNRYSYSPFGLELLRAEQLSQPFRYVGAYGVMTEPSGLLYMRARYYDPDTGRFLSEDPLGLEGGVNLYVYAGNNPVNYSDPSGLWVPQAIGAVIGGGSSAYANYDAYKNGKMSGWEYTQTILFGAATGAAASFAPGVVLGAVAGGTGSAANNLLTQSFTSDSIDSSQVGQSFVTGFVVGTFSGAGARAGQNVINPIKNNTGIIPRNHPYSSTGKGLPVANYGSIGGIIGTGVGTIANK
jgi:RHS repeat-associated protein